MCTAWALETLHSICVVTLAIKNRSYRGLNRSHILCFFFFNQEFRKLFVHLRYKKANNCQYQEI